MGDGYLFEITEQDAIYQTDFLLRDVKSSFRSQCGEVF